MSVRWDTDLINQAETKADGANRFCGDVDAEKFAACTYAVIGVVTAHCTFVAVLIS
ncbi:hypothetical protein [Streptosporangium sp. NPDC002721]|uniref:hypothetical protein n=1 Tax=Streptosporangium sp. NPDC002721 TaxID=3366188 RepID=UPI00367F9A61